MAAAKSLADKLWPRLLSTEGGCRVWTGCLNAWGYGSMSFGGGKTGLAHRAAWMLTYGEIPAGMMVLHRCDNPRCCNPEHLFLGTNSDNMADMAAKGRGRSRPGQHSPNAKLTMVQAAQIREMYPAKSQQKIADEFGVSQVAVSKIILGHTYRQDARLPATLA